MADFRLYSAAVVSELLVFLDDLGRALAAHFVMLVATLTPSMRVGDFAYLLDPLTQLLDTLSVAP